MDPTGLVASVDLYRHLIVGYPHLKDIPQAKQLCGHVAKHGVQADTASRNLVRNIFLKCERLPDRWPQRTTSSWTAVIKEYVKSGQPRTALRMYKQMKEDSLSPNKSIFLSALRACGILAELDAGKRIHEDIVEFGCESDMFVSTALVDMYTKCDSIVDARSVFDAACQRDVVSWNALIRGYAQQDLGVQALELYAQMQAEGVKPNDRTYVSLLKACGGLAGREEQTAVDGQLLKMHALRIGKRIQAEIACTRYSRDVFVCSTLVNMYAKCGEMVEARRVFDNLAQRSVVAWTAMMEGYTQQGHANKALQLYDQMQDEGVSMDERVFVSVLKACASEADLEDVILVGEQLVKAGALKRGRLLHADVVQQGYVSDAFVGNALLHMYASCGDLVTAENVFQNLAQRNLVSWTSMIAAYAQQDQGEKAMQLYTDMQMQGLKPNEATFVCILKACCNSGGLHMCHQIHQDIITRGLGSNTIIATSFIHAYSKCGSMVHAQQVFDRVVHHDALSWTALIAGYAHQGEHEMSLQCFEDMQLAGIIPNQVTYLCVLIACSHAGLVERGLQYFDCMTRDYNSNLTLQHYVTLVDLLGRAGLVSKAEDVLLKMPVLPNLTMWLCLLAACRKHNSIDIGRRAFDHAVALDPKHCAAYVLMSNIYADAQMWEDADRIQELRGNAGASKKPGQSWAQHEEGLCSFTVGDKSHKQSKQLYALLRSLKFEMELDVARGGV